MNTGSLWVNFDMKTDGMRELCTYEKIEFVLDYHGIPKIFKDKNTVYFNYPIEDYPEQVKIVDSYFEEIYNPFAGWYINAKNFYLLSKNNGNNEWNDKWEKETWGIAIQWVNDTWGDGEGDKWVKEESTPIDKPQLRKTHAKKRGRVKGRRKNKAI